MERNAFKLRGSVAADECLRLGIILGGSGNGEAIVANKIKGVRCCVCWNEESARLAKEHNDANIISIGSRMVTEEEGIKAVEAWLNASELTSVMSNPRAEHTNASEVPVLPPVYSTSVFPGASRPVATARSTTERAIRSLRLPVGL